MLLSAFRSLRYVGADRLEVVPRHPLSDLTPKYGSLDDRGAVVNAVVDAGVDDFLDDVVGAVEEAIVDASRAAEPDATGQTLRAEERGDRVRVSGGPASMGRVPLPMSGLHDLSPAAGVLLRGLISAVNGMV